MSSFPLKIMTPDGTAFDGQVQSVSCRTITGQVQLMARHIDYCTALGMGEAHITLEDGTQRSAACMGGMVSVLGGRVTLTATTFEWAEDIDTDRSHASEERAREKLGHGDLTDTELAMAEARLKRALIRQQVSRMK